MALAQSLLRLVDITRRYESPDDTAALTIIEGTCSEVASAESVATVGRSGSGKSPLLHIIGTLDRPTSGAVWLNDQDLSRLNEEQLASVRNRDIGFVFQAHYLLPQCTVLENVLVPTLATKNESRGSSASESKRKETHQARAERLLDR